jgi:hypothetical protein
MTGETLLTIIIFCMLGSMWCDGRRITALERELGELKRKIKSEEVR